MLPATIGEGVSHVSEPQPSLAATPEQHPSEITKGVSDFKTIVFMIILSFTCALILSVLASALAEPKEIAKDLDRSKQMMIAAQMLSHEGYFLMRNDEGALIPAKYSDNGILIPGTVHDIASNSQLIDIYKRRLTPLLVDDKGSLTTFEQAHLNQDQYIPQYKKTGYYKQPLKLIYQILSNQAKGIEGYVIPVNGFGLWDAIYGYLAVKPDGNTVIGITWYDQKETPGLGANISEAPWQNLFPGKQLFQEGAGGQTDFKTAPLGIVVVKGKVADVLGDSPKAKSAVDGMAGATLTGNGVIDAYRDVLGAYRPFLMKLQQEHSKKTKS